MRADHNSEADALYVRLTEGRVARSIELGCRMLVDLDEHGRVRDLEIVTPGHALAECLAEAERCLGVDAAGVNAAVRAAVAAADRTVHIEVRPGRER